MSDKMTMIATKGTLDWAYPPFILASTAAALGKEVSIFFTFYGLNLLLKDTSKLKVTPVGDAAMPMKMPFGPDWFQKIDWNPIMPNVLVNNVPGMDKFATWAMNKTTKKHGVASVAELREICQEVEVKFIACQMTIDLFGYDKNDFIDGVEFAGATTYFDEASGAALNLFV
jgi:peroxiredoxin family protein